MREAEFQRKLIKELKDIFPGCIIMKQDATYKQGIPDLVIFYKSKYAMLECKENSLAHHQPNQDHYIDIFNDWSFAKFIYPENKDSVLNELKIFMEVE